MMSMRGDRWGGESRLVPIERKRAEHATGSGYLTVRTMSRRQKGRVVTACAHRLAWQHFNGDIPPGICINHKNGIKSDNRPSNLELSTYSANMRHAHRTGLLDESGENNPAAKLSNKDVEAVRLEYHAGGITQAALGRRYGVAFQTISRIVRGDSRPKQGGRTADYTGRRGGGERHRDTLGRFSADGKVWAEVPR